MWLNKSTLERPEQQKVTLSACGQEKREEGVLGFIYCSNITHLKDLK